MTREDARRLFDSISLALERSDDPTKETMSSQMGLRAADALEAEILRLEGEVARISQSVLVPLTEDQVVEALHAGHAERRAAEGDNAWTSLLKRNADLSRRLDAVIRARDELAVIANRGLSHARQRIDELLKR